MAVDTVNPGKTNPVCQKCGLFKGCHTPFMASHGAAEPVIMIIGEAPGEEEDQRGRPFVGRSGQLLRQVLSELVGGKELDDAVRFSNVVRCRPPDNKIASQYVKSCRAFAVADIADYQPDYVLLMGGSALSGILGESGISSWNGTIIKKQVVNTDGTKRGITFVPLYHPAYILRNMNMLDEWLEAIAGALQHATDQQDYQTVFPHTVFEVKAMCEQLGQCEFIAFDTEVDRLDAYARDNRLLSISFAGGNTAYALPVDHPESWWSDKDKMSVKAMLIGMLRLKSGNVLGHNLKFDQLQVHAKLGLDFQAGGDTMLISHLLDSRQGIHGLKRLAGIRAGMYDYEAELKNYVLANPEANPARGGTYGAVPLDILLPYGARDAEAVMRLHDNMYEELSPKQKVLYDQMIVPASDMLYRMQANGLALDTYTAKRYAAIYTLRQGELMEEILADKKVQRMTQAHNNGLKGKHCWTFNPNSVMHLSELFYTHYRIPIPGYTAKGNPTTSSKALKTLEPKYPIVGRIRYYKLLTKMLSTYLTPAATGLWQGGDGLVRTTYNMHGTKTGRLSSSQPLNLQNIPTPEKEPGTLLQYLPIKNVFATRYFDPDGTDYHSMYRKGALLMFDYSGMELRVFASLAKCKPMLAIHRSGRDFHSMVAIMAMNGISPSDVTDAQIAALPKPVRYRYKWTNWTLLYGGDAYTLHNLYDMPIEDAKETVRIYYDTFPEVLEYRENCKDFAQAHGYIESPFGRREHLPYINDSDPHKRNGDVRAAVNMPVQSGASDLLLFAGIVIDAQLANYGYQARLANTVHDSLVVDTPREELQEVAELCVDVMENISTYAASYFPGVDFTWLLSPLKADAKVGSHYGIEMSLDEWFADFK